MHLIPAVSRRFLILALFSPYALFLPARMLRPSARVVLAPFGVVAGAALAAFGTGAWAASELRGGWIDLEGLGWWVAGAGYALFVPVFLALDTGAVRRRRGGLWKSSADMWRSLLESAILAVVGAVLLGVGLTIGAAGLADSHSETMRDVLASAWLVVTIWTVVGNVVARRRVAIARVEPHLPHDADTP